jgi:hypothetical protein
VGRKQTGSWQHLYLCTFILIITYCYGCASLQPVNKCKEANQQLLRTQQLLARGNFKGALAENRKIVSSPDSSVPKDEALFSMGIIYAHHKNPNKDYKQSIKVFKKLIHDYPQSPFAEQAKVWSEVLQIIEKLKTVDTEIEQKIRE